MIAANKTVEEMREYFGADSLAFLSTDNLIKAINLKSDAPNQGLCVAYFDGKYPTPLYDYQTEYNYELRSLQEMR